MKRIIFFFLFWATGYLIHGQTIDAVEYFFDEDPGYGLGTQATVSPGVNIQESFLTGTSGLSQGFHTLYVRARNDGGAWGLSESRLIFVDPSGASTSTPVNALEYFFDDDPGYGLGTPFIPTTPSLFVDILSTISTSSLNVGFHTIFWRAQDENGIWGLAESRLVFVDESGAVTTISNLEYYFDEDPGYGLGNSITPTTDASVINENSMLDISGLLPGFHTLFIRAQSSGGTWGISESRLVFIDPSGAGNATSVTDLEYFFDDDPGYGFATTITIPTPANMVDIVESIDTSPLSAGFHTLFIRARNDGGTWGMTESRLVFVDEAGAGTPNNVSQVEYFFDEDPGYGLGSSFAIGTPGTAIDVTELVTASDQGIGFHTLFMRAADENGVWGQAESKLIYVDASGTTTLVSQIEYFFDDDPGYGAATAVAVDVPATSVDINQSINTAAISPGFHTLYIRAQDDSGTWGSVESRLVFIDLSGVVSNVSQVEYFFDSDPGYGSGTSITVDTPGTLVDINGSINTAAINPGFHTLYIRAQDDNGTWGSSESKLVFVDLSGTVSNVSQIEYFFDVDPGYGLGNLVTVGTPSQFIDINENINTSGLSTGFHTLYVRSQDDNGTWGLSQSKLVFVDPANAGTIALIDELEYFFDEDPGFGSGTAIPVSNAEEVAFDVTLPAAALAEGQHTLTIRAHNTDGTWGIGETYTFSSLSPSRELDSLSLKVFYDRTEGVNWTTNLNWLSGGLETWVGVNVVGGRVESLELPGNNVTGKIPRELTYVSDLKKIDLSANALKDTIPDDFVTLTQLEDLFINDNDFYALPDISSITTLRDVRLDENFLDFGDLEPLVGISGLTYDNQKVEGEDEDSVVRVDQQLDFDFDINGSSNTYQWFLNDEPIAGATNPTFSVTNFALLDTGTYRVDVQNTIVTDLTISSNNFRATISDFEQDSLGMVSIYQNMGGTSWTNGSNWLTGDLDTWFGLNVTGGRVTKILLPGNGLVGPIPDDINLADAVDEINLSGNSIDAAVPSTVDDLRSLETLNLSNNEITSIPALNAITSLTNLDVSGNRLQFGDLELNLGVSNFVYAPQALISPAKDTLVETGTTPNLSVDNTGSNNVYEWFKDGTSVSTDEVLALTDVAFSDEGVYRLDITNTLVTGLTLSSGDINLRVSSLERDTRALQALYNQAGGDGWTNSDNWDLTDGAIVSDAWEGVSLNDDDTRVVDVNLSDHNLIGVVPDEFLEITQIETVNFSQNELTDIPMLQSLEQLTSFDISDNRMGFAPLEANATVDPGILNYANQKNVDIEETGDPEIKVEVNEDQTLSVVVNGSRNTYQWSLDGNAIEGATESAYTIDNIDIDKMGNYSVTIGSDSITDLTISSNARRVLAVTDVFGTIFQLNGTTPLTSGNITIYEIQDGPYDSLTTADLNASGQYLFEDIVLGDYNLLSRPDLSVDPENLQTYLGNGIFWEEADTLFLRTAVTGVDINMQGPPDDPNGDAAIFGIVEQDLPEEGRGLLPRRRSGRAGCAFRRSRGISRDDEEDFELVAYTETNENGEFRVENLEDGEYLFNIEFPGIPMDPNSFIAFNLGENLDDSELELAALITEDGITVDKIEEVGIPTPLFRNAVVFPNPTKDIVNFRYSLARPISGLQMTVVGVDGMVHRQESLEATFGLKETSLDISTLSAGMYMLVFQDTEGKYKQQIRITKH